MNNQHAELQNFRDQYEQAPTVLKQVLWDVSENGSGSLYDEFKSQYVPIYFDEATHSVERSYLGIGERNYTQQLIASYTSDGRLVSVLARPQIDAEHRHKDFFVASADFETGEITEWDVREVVFDGAGDKLVQYLTICPGPKSNETLALKLTSQGCTFDGQDLAPLPELEGQLSAIHHKFGHVAVQSYLQNFEDQAAIVAA